MFEEAAIARKESLSTPSKSENTHKVDRQSSTSPPGASVGLTFKKRKKLKFESINLI